MPDIAISREHRTSVELLLPHLKARLESAAAAWSVPIQWRSASSAKASGHGLTAEIWVDPVAIHAEAHLSFMLSFLRSTIEVRAAELIEAAISDAKIRA
ncbi:polyhydroxyalkanoic acid system family protein [Muricoccus aerilatus]|uniref:polyhydroxyalkanoic acid system family protein n=1 Tax=Muricoccus aerilatus TaxID=452982 RepID=UPI0009FD7803|nr:polyhydroxyalkanoic acid system family protein [Roseomonas aerilata]